MHEDCCFTRAHLFGKTGQLEVGDLWLMAANIEVGIVPWEVLGHCVNQHVHHRYQVVSPRLIFVFKGVLADVHQVATKNLNIFLLTVDSFLKVLL